MPVNGFSTGRDVSVTIVGQNGPIPLDQLIEFSSAPILDTVTRHGIDNVTRSVDFPRGWHGRLIMERRGNALDEFFANQEANYFRPRNGSAVDALLTRIEDTTLRTGALTMIVTIGEANGSVSQYRFVDVTLQLEDGGTWRGDDSVRQVISWHAGERLKD